MEAFRETIISDLSAAKIFIRENTENEVIAAHPHWHSLIEILLVIEGEYRQQIDNHFFNISKNDIVIVGEDQIHSTYAIDNTPGSLLVIQFHFDKYGSSKILFNNKISDINLVWRPLYELLMEIKDEYFCEQDGSFYFIKSDLYRIQGLLIRNKESIDISHNSEHPDKTFEKNVFRYINTNFMNDIKLVDAAKACHLSVPHFLRLFKKASGMPFKQYLNIYRVQLSNHLLLETKSVSKTAEMCGFQSDCSYVRLYKKYNNITPNQYIKSFLK